MVRPFSLTDDSLGLYVLNADLTQLWDIKFSFYGYLSDVLKINNQFLVYGAFNRFASPDGKEIVLTTGVSNVFLSVWDVDGNCVQTSSFPSEVSYFPVRINKINSDFIDIISIKEKNPADAILNENLTTIPYYFISNTKGVYYSF